MNASYLATDDVPRDFRYSSLVWMSASILFHTRGSFSISICGFMNARAYQG